MSGNSFGQLFKITSFGESHGPGIGVVIDGCPAGVPIDEEFIQSELDRRRPGQSSITTQRKEGDRFEIFSGIFEGKTTGTPIGILIPNEGFNSKDYDHLKDSFRPSQADYTYHQKYGIRDHRGGGRASARETVGRVAAGAIAKLLLAESGIEIKGFVTQVGPVTLKASDKALDLSVVETNIVRCPDEKVAAQMTAHIEEVRKEGNTVGGMIHCIIKGCPPGLGEPVFNKLQADLAKGMLSINAAKGFEYGEGFRSAEMSGTANRDEFFKVDGDNNNLELKAKTNHAGGILGGISNGMDIYFNVAFKPVATLMQPQPSVDKNGEAVTLEGKGNHDPCIVPRAVPIVEAMAALVIADHLLLNKTVKM